MSDDEDYDWHVIPIPREHAGDLLLWIALRGVTDKSYWMWNDCGVMVDDNVTCPPILHQPVVRRWPDPHVFFVVRPKEGGTDLRAAARDVLARNDVRPVVDCASFDAFDGGGYSNVVVPFVAPNAEIANRAVTVVALALAGDEVLVTNVATVASAKHCWHDRGEKPEPYEEQEDGIMIDTDKIEDGELDLFLMAHLPFLRDR